MLAGFLVGGLLAGFLIVGRRADRKSYVSFGPAMIAGAYVCAVLLPPL